MSTDSHKNDANTMESLNFMQKVDDLYNDFKKKNHKANIIIIGKTGVGKSTLINTVFKDNLATTGIGRPVTQKISEISKENASINILDTKGLEISDYKDIEEQIIDEIKKRKGKEAEKYINLAWLCISEESKRIEDAEINLAKSINELGVDVIVVITKASKFLNNEFEKEVKKHFSEIAKAVCLTRAIQEDVYDDDDEEKIISTRHIRGIDELISHSYRFIPDSQKICFASALSVLHAESMAVKREEAGKIIKKYAIAAAAAAAVPIPFSDFLTIAPLQIAMMLQISSAYGINVTKDSILPVISALGGTAATTMIGRTLFTSILKLVPGLDIAGSAISAGIAQQLTSALGHGYISAIETLIDEKKPFEIGAVIDLLKEKISK